MDLKLNDKIIVLTGGVDTISKSVAVKLIEEGGTPCILDECDSKEESRRAINEILLKYRRIDGLINNLYGQQKMEHYFMLASFARAALRKSRGSVVNICSLKAGFAFAEDWTHEWRDAEFRINNLVIPDRFPRHRKIAIMEAITSTSVFLSSENSRSLRSQVISVDNESGDSISINHSGFIIDIDKIFNGAQRINKFK